MPIPPPQILATIIEEEPEIELKYDWTGCSCIEYIKLYYPQFQGQQLYHSRHLWEHHEDYGLVKTEAERGALVITRDNTRYWHVAMTASVSEETIKILEKNLRPCQITTRVIRKDDPNIVGYLK